MIPTPFRFEPDMSDQDFQKLGQLSLRWSHIEHVIGNCLKVMLRLSDEEAVAVVFSLSASQRLNRMGDIADINGINPETKAVLDELRIIMRGVQYVRNNVVHAIMMEDDAEGHVFHLRSKMRSLTKAEVFSAEELTNYAAHLVLKLRYALGFKNDAGHNYEAPPRPEIPKFLRAVIQFPQC